MAEFLIKARGNQWMEQLAKESWATKNLTQEQYDARGEKGDVVQVLTDNQTYWFNDPPHFVLLRVPDIKFEEAKAKFEGGLYEEITVDGKTTYKLRKKRKFFISTATVDEIIKNKGDLSMKSADFEKVISERTLDAEKALTSKTVTLSASLIKETK